MYGQDPLKPTAIATVYSAFSGFRATPDQALGEAQEKALSRSYAEALIRIIPTRTPAFLSFAADLYYHRRDPSGRFSRCPECSIDSGRSAERQVHSHCGSAWANRSLIGSAKLRARTIFRRGIAEIEAGLS